jgi:two-component system chemotaxis response regulator CheB
MVVDDSAVIRGLITRILESDDDLEVVASVPNGRVAVDAVARRPVDVIVLDIEMPVMDGLEALPLLLRACPTTKVVMASTLTKRNADISMKALQAGATDYIAKPTSTGEIHSAEAFRGELLEKVRALAGAARPAGPAGGGGRAPAPRKVFSAEARQGVPARGRAPAGAPETARRARPGDGGNAALRAFPGDLHPAILAIGSSTGGPQALFQVLRHLSGALSVPLVLTQHMPPTFTTILAEHISRQCNLPAAEGVDGEPLLAGRCYVAPGDWHMTVAGSPGQAKLRLHQGPLVNFCRPAVDPMLQSVVQVYGARVLAVILTGMGQDGMVGCRAVTAAGGGVVAQDEATSVVWGMPGAVTVDGTAGAVLPVGEIGPFLRRHLARAAA